MSEIPIQAVYAELGYSQSWILHGFIDEPLARRQYDEFKSGEPYCQSTEHLRLHALDAWRSLRRIPTDAEIAAYIEVTASDIDRVFGASQLVRMLDNEMLSEDQFERVAAAAAAAGIPSERVARFRAQRSRSR